MNNKERLLRIFSDIKFIEDNEVEDEKYLVCFHQVHSYPHYSCWIKGGDVKNAAAFSVNDKGIRLLSVGKYTDEEIDEMKAMFNKWLDNYKGAA